MIESASEFIACPVHAQALEQPEGFALEGPDLSLSFDELDARVGLTGNRVLERGLVPGARVGIAAGNSAGYVVLLLALLRRGFVACPLNVRRPRLQLQEMAREIGCAAIIADPERNAAFEAPWPLEDLVGQPSGRAADTPRRIRLGRRATILFTSGSTGRPRAALHTYGNHWYNALGANENLPLAAGDRWLLSLPLYHVGGLGIVFRCMAAGAAVYVPEGSEPFAASVAARGITHLSLVPTQLRRLLDDPQGLRIDHLRGVLLGGAPVPGHLVRRALDRGLPIHTSYGLTETASQVTSTPPGAPERVLESSGRPLRFREISLAADGEIRVRGRTLFAGYVRGNSMALPLDDEGWFRTGDLGRIDEQGLLHVTGRRDNLFISGGENIQPEEIEAALVSLDEIEDAVVVPVSDPEFGARPVAVIRAGSASIDQESVRARLRGLLPGYMIPVAFIEEPAEPSKGNLKLDRRRLERHAAAWLASTRRGSA